MEQLNFKGANGRFFKFLFKIAVIGTLIMYHVPTVVVLVLSIPYTLWIVNYLLYSLMKTAMVYYTAQYDEMEVEEPGLKERHLKVLKTSEKYL